MLLDSYFTGDRCSKPSLGPILDALSGRSTLKP